MFLNLAKSTGDMNVRGSTKRMFSERATESGKKSQSAATEAGISTVTNADEVSNKSGKITINDLGDLSETGTETENTSKNKAQPAERSTKSSNKDVTDDKI